MGQLKETNMTSTEGVGFHCFENIYTLKKIHQRRDKAKALEKIYSPAAMSLKQDGICNAATEPALVRVMDREHKQTLREEKMPMVTVSGGK